MLGTDREGLRFDCSTMSENGISSKQFVAVDLLFLKGLMFSPLILSRQCKTSIILLGLTTDDSTRQGDS